MFSPSPFNSEEDEGKFFNANISEFFFLFYFIYLELHTLTLSVEHSRCPCRGRSFSQLTGADFGRIFLHSYFGQSGIL